MADTTKTQESNAEKAKAEEEAKAKAEAKAKSGKKPSAFAEASAPDFEINTVIASKHGSFKRGAEARFLATIPEDEREATISRLEGRGLITRK